MKTSKEDLYRFAMQAEEIADKTENRDGCVYIDKVSAALGIEKQDGREIANRLHQRGWGKCDFGPVIFTLNEFGRDELEKIRLQASWPKWRQWIENNKVVLSMIGGSVASGAIGLIFSAIKHFAGW